VLCVVAFVGYVFVYCIFICFCLCLCFFFLYFCAFCAFCAFFYLVLFFVYVFLGVRYLLCFLFFSCVSRG